VLYPTQDRSPEFEVESHGMAASSMSFLRSVR